MALKNRSLFLAGGQPILYTYVDGDPINRVDPTGDDWLNFLMAVYGMKQLGFDTELDGAVFWAGIWNGVRATEFAKCQRKKTIVMTPGGGFMDWVDRYNKKERNVRREEPFVDFASAAFASGASGTAWAFVRKDGGMHRYSRWFKDRSPS